MYPALNIVVTDDDPDDVLFFKEAVNFLHLSCRIETCVDGRDLLEFLDKHADWPHLIILDLNMPKVDGFQVLRRLSVRPGLNKIPVFVLTTSYNPPDLEKCKSLGCLGAFTKPMDLTGYATILHEILHKINHR